MNEIIQSHSHRPWPLPRRPWVMRQSWSDLLFAHWPVNAEVMQRLLPAGLTVDTTEGTAWVGVVPFRMHDVYPRSTFAVPWLSDFPELNVRTYVTAGDPVAPKPGVFFFSLDAGNPVAVSIARHWFRLPYYRAQMQVRRVGEDVVYRSLRTHTGAYPARLVATYGPGGDIYHATRGSLEHWLTERYCLYTIGRQGQVLRGDIHHVPWPLQAAWARFPINTMVEAAGLEPPSTAPLLHFVRRIDVAVWPLQEVLPTTG